MKFDVFCSFFHSLCSNDPERVINRNGLCYFLYASNWWPVCWRVRVQSHASNGEDWYECGCRGSTLKRFCSNVGHVILWIRENLLNYLRDCKSSEAYLFFLNNFLTWLMIALRTANCAGWFLIWCQFLFLFDRKYLIFDPFHY